MGRGRFLVRALRDASVRQGLWFSMCSVVATSSYSTVYARMHSVYVLNIKTDPLQVHVNDSNDDFSMDSINTFQNSESTHLLVYYFTNVTNILFR